MLRFVLAGAIAFAAALVACSNDWRPLATPVDGNPCGNAWHSCGNGACCVNGDACGGGPFNGCPAGSCCPTQEGAPLVGARPPYPQRRALQ